MTFFVIAANSTSSFTFTVPSITLNNGLLELTALTTLIGSGIAVSLCFGTRGSAGLAWAPMSAFGTVGSYVLVLLTLSFRSSTSDGAIGMELDLGVTWSARANSVRKHMDRALGVVCDARDREGAGKSWRDVYAFDLPTAAILSRLPDTKPEAPLRIFTYAKYDFLRKHDTRFHMFTLLATLTKLAEIYVLWMLGNEFVLKRRPESEPGNLDILAGQVPRVGQEGGSRKVVLGVAENPRRLLPWKIMWATGAFICAGSLVFLYFVLGQQPNEVVFAWVGFQLLWLVLRILVYHLAEPEDPLINRSFSSRSFQEISDEMKLRVIRLALALSKYQTHGHPRGDYSYTEDCFSEKQLLLFRTASRYPHYQIPPTTAPPTSFKVNVMAVVGDTTLSSALWVMGKSKLTPMDLYDCCILLFSMHVSALPNAPRKTFMVPSVRALSGRSLPSHFIPKGSSNLGFGLTWYYWIPCEGGLWLELATEEDTMRIVGDHQVQVMTDEQLTAKFAAGTLNIGCTHVDDIKQILKICQGATQTFLELLS
ncbi:hypothetical protein BDQ17DRAFT_1375831 [Cyathus striatus]|nr:hypothetical protein BDQ17DRAFT_1375831 [Cyathus striatus]